MMIKERAPATVPEIEKLLILTATPPDRRTFGGRFITELTSALGSERVSIALLSNSESQLPDQCSTLKLGMPPSPAVSRHMPRISKFEETVYWLFRQRFFNKLEKLVQEISSFAASNRVLHIVSIVDHPAIIWLTRPVASSLNISYSTYLSEVPQTSLVQAGYDRRSQALIEREFSMAARSAYATGFASKEMSDYYAQTLAVKTRAILAPGEVLTERTKGCDSETIRIGCLLDNRHQQSVKDLITACQKCSFQIGGKPISLRLIGSASGIAFMFAGKPAEIELLGGLSQEETVTSLSECTFNYLPFWTDKQFALSARLSIPDQLPIYLNARRPVLANAPAQSQIADLINEFSLGSSIESSNENSFITTLEDLVTRADQDDCKDCCQKAARALFSSRLFLDGLESLIPPAFIEKNSPV